MKRLDAALARILAEPDTKERMNRISVIASYLPPAETRKLMAEDSEINGELIRATKMRLE